MTVTPRGVLGTNLYTRELTLVGTRSPLLPAGTIPPRKLTPTYGPIVGPALLQAPSRDYRHLLGGRL